MGVFACDSYFCYVFYLRCHCPQDTISAAFELFYRFIRPQRGDVGHNYFILAEVGDFGGETASEWRVRDCSKPSQAKVLTGGGDLREAQVDVPLSLSHSRV